MKHVFSSETVAHLWANQTQESARNPSHSVFFDNGIIFSYGHHFPVAKHVKNSRGEKAILFTSRSYSVTTAKHKSFLRRAIPAAVPVFYVHDVTAPLHAKMLDEYQHEIDRAVEKAEHSTKYKQFHLGELEDRVAAFALFAKWLGIDATPTVPAPEWFTTQREKVAVFAAREQWRRDNPGEYEKRRREQLAKRNAKAIEVFEREKSEWLGGMRPQFPRDPMKLKRGHYFDRFAYLRIDPSDPAQVETSRRAYVPLEHVLRAAPFILRIIKRGETYQRNGHSIHLRQFVVESIDANGVLTVGCHQFSREEVLRFAEVIAGMKTAEQKTLEWTESV